MSRNITFKFILQSVLEKKKTLIIGQMVTVLAIMISIPIPLLLPMLVDEVLLDKPSSILASIDTIIGSGDAFYYISIVTLSVIILRIVYFILSVIITKIFTKISTKNPKIIEFKK